MKWFYVHACLVSKHIDEYEKPILKRSEKNMFGSESMRTLLARFLNNGTVLNEVFLVDTDSDIQLMGVTVQSVQGDYVAFSDATGSPALGTVYVPINKIVAIDA